MFSRIAILAFLIFISVNVFAEVKSDILLKSNQTKFSRNETRAAKYLEEFYLNFKKDNLKKTKRSFQNFKNQRSKLLKKYTPLLSSGTKQLTQTTRKRSIECLTDEPDDQISKMLVGLFKSKCIQYKVKKVLNSKKLSKRDVDFIHNNLDLFINRKNRKLFVKKLDSWTSTTTKSVSEALSNHVLKHKRLPHQSLLKYLEVDEKLTNFIQENNLFDQSNQGYFSREFTSLVKSFKSFYLSGDDQVAKSYLLDAIDFYEQNHEKIDDSKAWLLFITSGKKVARRENFGLALELFKLSEKSADNEQIFESKFQTLFAFYRERQLSEARRYIREKKLLNSFEDLNSKLRFWISRVYEESKEYKKAKELYIRQIKSSPLSFYSILSLKNLRSLSPQYEVSLLIDKEDPSLDLDLKKPFYEKAKVFNLFRLANTNILRDFQALELRKLPAEKFFVFDNSKFNKEKIEELKSYFLVKFFSKNENHLQSFKVAYTNLNKGKIKLNPLIIRSLFPLKYRDVVKSHAPKIEDRVILSLIRQESAFNEKARSLVGARGLMQIMPATGRQFIKNLKAHKLYRPNLNIKIGSKYLISLLDRYDGDLVFALSAYNAGMGNVGKWLKSIPFNDDVLSNIELIPFKETRNYVKLIYRNLFFYSFIDGSSERLNQSIDTSFKVSLND